MGKIKYQKQSLSPAQQADLLLSRGITISDRKKAEHFLAYHNYYYVSGYIYYFEKNSEMRTHVLAQNIDFNDIIVLIKFDQKLREILFRAVQEIEFAMRSVIARKLSLRHGPFCLENQFVFTNIIKAELFKEHLLKTYKNHKNEKYITHFTERYVEPLPPIWVMIEVLTLGNVSQLYSALLSEYQKEIAGEFGVDHIILISWLKALTELRNTCAHHSRLWNKGFVNYPKIRKSDHGFPISENKVNHLGSFLPMIFHLMYIIVQNNEFRKELREFCTSCSLIKKEDMGLFAWWAE